VSGSTAIKLALIQECIRTDRYIFTNHALTKHPPKEGFQATQALQAILNGTIIEDYPEQDRCLISGTASGLRLSSDYVTTYIHSVCCYDDIEKVVVITMYRPSSDEWLNGERRRRKV
jgi:hypothetical protein